VQRDFFTHALNNPDQLRQRVAFALSQIMVVSSVEIYEAYGLADYQNILLSDALGNYRTLLQDVTLSPVMGHYLDMANSSETNPQNGTVPNQNYAREVLQLFSIGLVRTQRRRHAAAGRKRSTDSLPSMEPPLRDSRPFSPAGLIRRSLARTSQMDQSGQFQRHHGGIRRPAR
jgi:hypothetical protein